jgi:hypothetical protein
MEEERMQKVKEEAVEVARKRGTNSIVASVGIGAHDIITHETIKEKAEARWRTIGNVGELGRDI